MAVVIEVWRDATLISMTFCDDGILSDFTIDDNPGAGTYDYSITARTESLVADIGFSRLLVTQLKR